jgi:transcriptional regulator GlxA family with amidase domain
MSDTPSRKRRVAILIFDDVEVLDFAGPFEVFGVTGGREHATTPFEVFTVAERGGPIRARNGLTVTPHVSAAGCPGVDVLVVPGGYGTRREMHNAALIDWIRARAAEAEIVLSVCTGALLLGRAGLLDGLEATTHHGALDLLAETAPRAVVRRDRRVIDNGHVITAAGISAGIDAALYVVARLLGEARARETAAYMEYDWRPTPARAAEPSPHATGATDGRRDASHSDTPHTSVTGAGPRESSE